ncbi:MAG: hypothetical protein JNM19_19280, partial [Chitinophagaceae bacterium]|nr:hypothetical protein [Chitinophagaceae bacterium]
SAEEILASAQQFSPSAEEIPASAQQFSPSAEEIPASAQQFPSSADGFRGSALCFPGFAVGPVAFVVLLGCFALVFSPFLFANSLFLSSLSPQKWTLTVKKLIFTFILPVLATVDSISPAIISLSPDLLSVLVFFVTGFIRIK